MKKFTRIFSFLTALIFCFATMSLNIFAANRSVETRGLSACPNHPYAGCYALSVENFPDYHYLCCNECDIKLDLIPCDFRVYADCTDTAYCTQCINTRLPLYPYHDFSGVTWNDGGYLNYHWRKCKNGDCWVEEHGDHDRAGDPVFKKDGVHDTCNLCGYEWPAE